MTGRADPGAGVRGLLFADLRGYTGFVDRHGDAAGLDLLDRYRDIVRTAVAGQGGAEIRTEGDSFYVVFPTPSSAVKAGLAIVEAAGSPEARDSGPPIAVGVGVHAGETAESTTGPVGGAVNVAARICARARPGEVLVSDTVRGLVRTRLEATFTDRGRPMLKGVAEPIRLWAVAPQAAATAASRWQVGARPRTSALGVAGAAAAFLALGLLALIVGRPPAASPSPTIPSTSQPSSADANSNTPSSATRAFTTVAFRPTWTSELHRYGLRLIRDEAGLVQLGRVGDPLDHKVFVVNTLGGVDGCEAGRMISPGALAMIDYFTGHPDLAVEGVESAVIGGHAGYTISMLPPLACSIDHLGLGRNVTFLFSGVDLPGVLERKPDGSSVDDPYVRAWVADVAGQTVTIVAIAPNHRNDLYISNVGRFVEGLIFDGT